MDQGQAGNSAAQRQTPRRPCHVGSLRLDALQHAFYLAGRKSREAENDTVQIQSDLYDLPSGIEILPTDHVVKGTRQKPQSFQSCELEWRYCTH